MKKLLRFIRRILGTEHLLPCRQIKELIRIEMCNAMYQLVHLEKIKASTEYQNYKKIFSLLKPMDVKNGKFIRLGKNHDGGYIMLDLPDWRIVDFAYSLGIERDVSWDEDMAKRGIDIFMYDHTITSLPKQNERFHFVPFGVTGYEKKPKLKTLKEMITMNGHDACQNLILKMDVEGAEWDVFTETNAEVINQFSQIILELHDMTSLSQLTTIIHVLEKINQTHQSVHVHYNNFATPMMFGDMILSPTVEVLFVRRKDFEFESSTRIFPTMLDQPNNPSLPDVALSF